MSQFLFRRNINLMSLSESVSISMQTIIRLARSVVTSLKVKIQERGLPYLLCGVVNTLFGYFGSLGIYYSLRNVLIAFWIVIIARIVTITFSFFTYKVFIFKTKGHWLREYIRCHLSYGFISIITMTVLIVLVDYAGVPFWLAQLFTICLGVFFSFIAHTYYTFSHK